MVFAREDDPSAWPWGFRLYVHRVQPVFWLATETLAGMLDDQDHALTLGWEPKVEVEFRDGAMLTLTIRAENGTWIWRFTDYDHQRDAYRLAWPD
jgi:hypothetical protein